MALTEKFKTKDLDILRNAAKGEIFLDVKTIFLKYFEDILQNKKMVFFYLIS